MTNPLQTFVALCRRFEQRFVPWPLLFIIVLTIAAILFGLLAP